MSVNREVDETTRQFEQNQVELVKAGMNLFNVMLLRDLEKGGAYVDWKKVHNALAPQDNRSRTIKERILGLVPDWLR